MRPPYDRNKPFSMIQRVQGWRKITGTFTEYHLKRAAPSFDSALIASGYPLRALMDLMALPLQPRTRHYCGRLWCVP
jgi:hypothetical protein